MYFFLSFFSQLDFKASILMFVLENKLFFEKKKKKKLKFLIYWTSSFSLSYYFYIF